MRGPVLTRIPLGGFALLVVTSCVPESRLDDGACAPVCERTCGLSPCEATCGGLACAPDLVATFPVRSAPVCLDGDVNEVFVGEARPTAHLSVVDRAARSVVAGSEVGGVSIVRRDAARDRVFFAVDQTHSPEVPRGVWMLDETNTRHLLEAAPAISGLALFDARVAWTGSNVDGVQMLRVTDPTAQQPSTVVARFDERAGVVERCPNGDFVIALPDSGSIVGWNEVRGVYPVLTGTRKAGEATSLRHLACVEDGVFFDGPGTLSKAGFAGGGRIDLVGGQRAITGLVADERRVIWLDGYSGTLWQVPATTRRLERVLSGLEAPRGLVAVGAELLFLAGEGGVWRVGGPDGLGLEGADRARRAHGRHTAAFGAIQHPLRPHEKSTSSNWQVVLGGQVASSTHWSLSQRRRPPRSRVQERASGLSK